MKTHGFHKDFRPLIRELRASGCDVIAGGKHARVERDGKLLATLSVTTSNRRALANARAELRRAGALR